HPEGKAKGPTLSPLYRTAPQAALADPSLHRLLALLDALRTGRARERNLAAQLLEAELMRSHAEAPDAGR
ncbi:MAG: MarR family transcriptional regulator, partial [Comamonadaceae bacterium]